MGDEGIGGLVVLTGDLVGIALLGTGDEKRGPFGFPPLAERSWIIFPGDTRSGKKSFHHATCERGPSRWDGPLSRQSGV